MILRAQATSSSVGEKISLQGATCEGWISVLPSMPSVRPCSHSSRKPAVVAEVVVDAVEDVEPVGARRDDGHGQPRHDGDAVVQRAGTRFLQKVVGAHDEAGEPVLRIGAERGDLARIQH